MKIRNGFVSNSSSSSYIISYDPEIDITDLIEYNREYSEDVSRVNYIGIRDIVEHIRTWYDLDCEQDVDSVIETYKHEFAQFASYVALISDEVNAGKEVAYITIPYGYVDNLDKIDGIKFVKGFG